jgi:hypothetical protein
MVYRCHPTLCALVFCIGILKRFAFNLQNHIYAVAEADDKIRFIKVWIAVVFIGNIKCTKRQDRNRPRRARLPKN